MPIVPTPKALVHSLFRCFSSRRPNENGSRPFAGIPRTTQFAVLMSVMFLGSPVIWAQDQPTVIQEQLDPVKTERPSFEYEQCQDGCRQQFDQAVTQCFEFYDAESDEFSQCFRAARADFKSALHQCPYDTGRWLPVD